MDGVGRRLALRGATLVKVESLFKEIEAEETQLELWGRQDDGGTVAGSSLRDFWLSWYLPPTTEHTRPIIGIYRKL